jgi:hypothetical protein
MKWTLPLQEGLCQTSSGTNDEAVVVEEQPVKQPVEAAEAKIDQVEIEENESQEE